MARLDAIANCAFRLFSKYCADGSLVALRCRLDKGKFLWVGAGLFSVRISMLFKFGHGGLSWRAALRIIKAQSTALTGAANPRPETRAEVQTCRHHEFNFLVDLAGCYDGAVPAVGGEDAADGAVRRAARFEGESADGSS